MGHAMASFRGQDGSLKVANFSPGLLEHQSALSCVAMRLIRLSAVVFNFCWTPLLMMLQELPSTATVGTCCMLAFRATVKLQPV